MKLTMRHIITLFLMQIFFLTGVFSLSCSNRDEAQAEKEKVTGAFQVAEKVVPLQLNDIVGSWRLKYPDNYGYDFRFYKNYRALVVLYLNNDALLFKGVYTIEETNQIRINIYEMKRENNVKSVNTGSGFIKAKSSYFLFRGAAEKGKKPATLILNPVKIFIDGNDSDGYFEPVMRLKRL